jgi:hypothetical protein
MSISRKRVILFSVASVASVSTPSVASSVASSITTSLHKTSWFNNISAGGTTDGSTDGGNNCCNDDERKEQELHDASIEITQAMNSISKSYCYL